MRKIVVASIAAFASLYTSAHVAANVANNRDAACAGCHEGWHGSTMPTPEMARDRKAVPAPKINPKDITGWYIRGMQTLRGETTETRYTRHQENGEIFVVIFESKQQCENARAKDPSVAGGLASYAAVIKARGGNVVISCQPWVLPVTPDDEPQLPAGHPPIDKPPGVDI